MGGRKEPKVIIAMKGLPCTGRTSLASVLAKTLKLSVVKLDDVRDSVVGFQRFQEAAKPDPSSSAKNPDDLSYQHIFRILPKQLQLKSKLIFDSPLAEEIRFQQLRKVADDSDAALVIVECKPKDAYLCRKWFAQEADSWEDLENLSTNDQDYDVGNSPKLTVNTSAYVEDVDIAHAVMRLSGCSYGHRLDFHDWAHKQFEPLEGEILSSGKKLAVPGDHFHVFTCSAAGEGVKCNGCLEAISGPAYNCSGCKFWLHKSCAESPSSQEVGILPHNDLPFLQSTAEAYCFPETHWCGSCEGSNKEFSDGCIHCLFQTNIRCRLLPTVINHPCHDEGSLFLVIFPLTDGFEYNCFCCREIGMHVGYVCVKCFFVIHVRCALLPLKVKYKYHQHDLELIPPKEIVDSKYEQYCDICETERNVDCWLYSCKCDSWDAHMDCALKFASPSV